MSVIRIVDSPLSWALAGLTIGLVIGVTVVSVWLIAIGLIAFLFYLRFHGPVQRSNEGWLFAAGPTFMMSWILGFVLKGLIF